jgi:hypothetical protein
MLHPVGSQPPSVYWRRRLFVFGSIIVLLVLVVITIKVATSGGADPAAADGTKTAPRPTQPAPSTTSRHSSTAPKTSTSRSSSPRTNTSVPPATCVVKDLGIAAVVGKTGYRVGDQPLVELQVTNKGSKPCVQDLADKQVELKVYNGESRVWGSHDCKIQSGTSLHTLTPKTPVRVAITWSGLSSQPGCAGTRQRVGAGTYTLYAVLSGRTGTATQFTIS